LEYERTRFVVMFVGREERYLVVVKGRKLHGINSLILQLRLEWIEAVLPKRNFAENRKPIITRVELVKEEERRRRYWHG
jgi:hypothetical protein